MLTDEEGQVEFDFQYLEYTWYIYFMRLELEVEGEVNEELFWYLGVKYLFVHFYEIILQKFLLMRVEGQTVERTNFDPGKGHGVRRSITT